MPSLVAPKPKAPPAPPPPAPMPAQDDAAIQAAKKKQQQAASIRSGRQSTILTDFGTGLGTSDKMGG